jgi:M6 family metalloprotease-like protein
MPVIATTPALDTASAQHIHVLATPVVISPRARVAAPAIPDNLAAAPASANLRLWIYDPRTPNPSGLATGIFIQDLAATSGWQFVPANPDGSVYARLAPGNYQFDTIEPNEALPPLQRHRYQVVVPATGAAGIQGLEANSQGIFPVTLDQAVAPATSEARRLQDELKALASQGASTFRPTSPCQLLDQVAPQRSFGTDLSAGFPRVRVRLPSFGQLRALIVPVDFPDVRGKDEPASYFTPLAIDVRDFYLKQSYGRLSFDFDILPDWVRLPFSPGRFGFTSANGSGDFTAYRNAIIALTESQIDYSKYDAVYFLVPKEMPMAQMGYGPAITTPTWTSTGYVVNGATGGADMYYNDARGVDGAKWKWMAHETGHAFGLYDEDLGHASATLGSWSIMANNWSNRAIEHNGWDRYLQGWLPESQVACLPKTALAGAGNTVQLSPLVRQDAGTKVAMVPLSSSKILVMESRKNEGYDHLPADHAGVLVYTVDMTAPTLGGGYRTQRRRGSTDRNFQDAALHVGDSVTVAGLTVTVTATSADGDTVSVHSQQ